MQAFDDSDSGDDFASASEGEYDTGAAASSTSSAQQGQLKQNRRKSLRPKKKAEGTPSSPPTLMHVQPDVHQVPLQHSSIDSPPARTLGSWNMQHSAASQSPPSRAADASFSNQFHASRSTSSLQSHSFSTQPVYHDQFEPIYNHGPGMPPRTGLSNMQNPGAQRGWGSLSSWVNAAVSTVSEVIENPNVVVSKAQNISQGIRNVASEQIDRVYESLDPEYEYERERQNHKQQQFQPQQTPLKQTPRSTPLIAPKSTTPPSNDISDLLGGSPKESQLPTSNHPAVTAPARQPLNGPSPPEPIRAKLDYKEEPIDQEADAWGDDGWGDSWDDGKDMTVPTAPSPPTPTANNNSISSVISSGQTPKPAPLPEKKDAPAKREMRPADALFSTLDFASNAIGSAVLGVHQKVTQAHANGRRDSQSSVDRSRTPELSTSFSQQKSWGKEETVSGHGDFPEKTDRLALLNPKLDVVGTGLGALESLGKKAAGAIADVVPRNMTYVNLFEEAGGHTHLTKLSNVAQDSSNRSRALATNDKKILEMDQLFQVEQLLSVPSLTNTVGDRSMDLLAGHKDFRATVALLEKMGVHGTTPLRQLRNCTRKLGTLVQDTVNAFEQEWHNHQSRASEKDFFAKAPIKFFFESRLLTIYFDSIRALTQYTEKTCDQILRLGESFKLKAVERAGEADPTADPSDHRPALEVAEVLLQLVGNLIVEAMFLVQTYDQTLDAILKQAKTFTTPLDRLDWDDLLFGSKKLSLLLLEQDTPAAIGNVQSITLLVAEVLKFDLVIDAVHGKLTPTFTPRPPQPQMKPPSQPKVQLPRATPQPQLRQDTLSNALRPPIAPSSSSGPITPPMSRSSTMASPTISAAALHRQTPNRLGMTSPIPPASPITPSFSRPESPSPSAIQRPPSRGSRLGPSTDAAVPPVPKPATGIETTGFRATTPRPIRAKPPAPAPKPKLADEDFFSILNG
ncbi:hypothetical protein BG006_010413 [Podila minutissima]|uniref:Uncharacterized protein n=1 Tax=Podila minutissima TaxID=64525 RepID=A0A9P5SGZ6_9FUNG|nr:hypothetical protein BG006_010413 [Podila minutissima]